VKNEGGSSAHYQAVAEARRRLRAVEERYELALKADSAALRDIGREYAAIVQEYATAVMNWLSSIDRKAKGGETSL
jgi:hypothetical protein